MAGEEPTNKPDTRSDLRADPNLDVGKRPEPEKTPEHIPEQASAQAPEQAPDQTAEPAQKDAPLPAFIYGRDGRGDAQGRNNRSADRQNFNAWIGDMDRKTLLGLITGAGMLGLVLFFAGMLVGAGLFMDSSDPETVAQNDRAPVEMLATEPDEPSVSAPMPQSEPTTAPDANETVASEDDPVGDLIAERTDALSETDGQTDQQTSNDTAADNDAVVSDSEPVDATAAPAAPDVDGASDDNALTAPEIRGTDAEAADQAPAAEAQEPAAAAEKSTAAKEPAEKEAASKPAETKAPAASADSAAKPFSVQVGAFKVHENASQRAEELRKEGLEVAVVIRGAEGEGAWYYVRVGKYANLAQARDDAAKIKKNQGVDGFPVRAEPNDREVE